MAPIIRQLEKKAIKKLVNHGRFLMAKTNVTNNIGISRITKKPMLGTYEYRPTPVLMSLWINGPIIWVKTAPRMDFNRWVCRMLVELMPLVIDTKTVLSFIPISNLNNISRITPEINKTLPVMIEITRYLVESISFLIICDEIKNIPKKPKNIMSFPLEEPIKNN